MYRTNPESWLHQDSKMVPCAQCTHNPMMLWLSVAFIEYTEYSFVWGEPPGACGGGIASHRGVREISVKID